MCEHVERLAAHAQLHGATPFVAQFYAEPSAYVFYDAEGAAHEIAQGEGGEQGNPPMPALYALGQNPALLQAHAASTPGEDLYGYLDDIYVTCQPERAGPAFAALGTALWERANIRAHLRMTRAWNAAGEEPSALLDALPAAARADAWAGRWARPPAQQGITVLGTPLGHAAYIAGALRRVREKHDELLGRIPTVACASHCHLKPEPAAAVAPSTSGGHRAACPTAGVLVRRACSLERAAARICREAGARVATNVFLRDLNLGLLTDGRRLEVVAHGLPAFGGVLVAVDVTLASPLRRDGSSRSRADHEPGLALRTAAERKHRVTYPAVSPDGPGPRSWREMGRGD